MKLDWLRFLELVLGGDSPSPDLGAGQIAARAAVVYVIGMAVVRAGKSRMIGRVTAVDVLLGFILGSLLSRGITGHASLSGTAVASATLVFAHWLVTRLACRSHWFGTLIKGHARVIIRDGQIFESEMRKSHISEHDLEEQLRLNGVEEVRQVKLAYKERNGEISVLKK